MKAYHHASVKIYEKNVYFTCTDPNTTDLLMKELKTVNSDFTIVTRDDVFGELGGVSLKFKPDEVVDKAGHWFIKKLCSMGWKPLGNREFRYEYEIETTY